jgi:hypothetical protein
MTLAIITLKRYLSLKNYLKQLEMANLKLSANLNFFSATPFYFPYVSVKFFMTFLSPLILVVAVDGDREDEKLIIEITFSLAQDERKSFG